MFTCTWYQLHGFPRLISAACFPALDKSCVFSRDREQLHVFPRFTSVAFFPALDISCIFPALDITCMLSRGKTTTPYFHALENSSMFTRARQQLNGFPALATTTVVGYTISLLQKKCTLQTLTNQEVVFKSRVRPKAQRHKVLGLIELSGSLVPCTVV